MTPRFQPHPILGGKQLSYVMGNARQNKATHNSTIMGMRGLGHGWSTTAFKSVGKHAEVPIAVVVTAFFEEVVCDLGRVDDHHGFSEYLDVDEVA
jgi:hypothetical protein